MQNVKELFMAENDSEQGSDSALIKLAKSRCQAHKPGHKFSLWKKMGSLSLLEMGVNQAIREKSHIKVGDHDLGERSIADTVEIVLVNGQYQQDASCLLDGVEVQASAQVNDDEAKWQDFLEAMPEGEVPASMAVVLSTSWITVSVSRPVKIKFQQILTSPGAHALNLRLVVGDGVSAECTDNIRYSVDGGQCGVFYNRDILLGSEAILKDNFFNKVNTDLAVMQSQRVVVGRQADYQRYHVATGGQLVRHYHQVELSGEGGACSFSGVCLGAHSQRHDQTILVRHHSSHTVSTQSFKNVARHKSLTNFSSRVYVKSGIKEIDSSQINHNLLVDNSAQALSAPELEVYSDEVQCAHGSTVGAVDAKAVMYLRSRGLSKEQAEALLVEGFIQELIASFSHSSRDVAYPIAEEYLSKIQ